MFACLYSLSAPVAALVKIAEDFTPRFAVVGPLVVLDLSGLSRLFGTPREMGEQLRDASREAAIRIALAPTQTAAALIALGRPGLAVVSLDDQRAVLAPLPVSVLAEFERVRARASTGVTATSPAPARLVDRARDPAVRHHIAPPHVGEMEDVLPYFQSSLGRTSDAAAAPHRQRALVARAAPGASAAGPRAPGAAVPTPSAPGTAPSAPPAATPVSGGWAHPRDSHAAAQTRRPRRDARTPLERTIEAMLDTLRRWGVRTLGELAALPSGDVYERFGARGVLWQRLARGDDSTPLVPWVPEDPFEAALALEWPIEGLEPLSFVLGRLLEPLAERLERADRGAAILHTHVRLVDKTVHARTLQLPAPMRDPKILRTLVLLDLETNPPAAAIDHVRVLVEPTPARVTQWALFERAQPSPEQVSTLLARLTALMGDSHVGAPRLVDSWQPGAFEMAAFALDAPGVSGAPSASAAPGGPALAPNAPGAVPGAASGAPAALGRPGTALRRFRLPIPTRVHVHDGRPTRIVTDRRGISGGPVVQAAGPWRTSGEWWHDVHPGRAWDRDEWDVALADGTVYRLYVERAIGHWFLEGVVD